MYEKQKQRQSDMRTLRGCGFTLNETGKLYGITKERVRQILARDYDETERRMTEIANDQKKKLEEIMKELRDGSDINTYKGSISQLTGMKHGTRERNRELIRIRDNYTCNICGKVWTPGNRRLDVHHIDGDNNKTKKVDDLSIEKENLITLCHRCHFSLHAGKYN